LEKNKDKDKDKSERMFMSIEGKEEVEDKRKHSC
jgi:hypothetical protein